MRITRAAPVPPLGSGVGTPTQAQLLAPFVAKGFPERSDEEAACSKVPAVTDAQVGNVNSGPSLNMAVAKFVTNLHRTVGERAQDQVLARHAITQSEFEALTSQARQRIEAELEERAKLLLNAVDDKLFS